MKLSEIFADHMTLQCGKPVKIWGESEEEREITVLLNGEEIASVALMQGAFSFFLPPQPALESAELVIGDITLRDVDFGEVFIAGGQSNMEFLLRYDADYRRGEPIEKDAHLRFYDVGEYAFEGEKEEGFKSGAFWDRWFGVDPEKKDDLEHFSAVGFYFARELRRVLQRPVAIVGCNWGGTTASTWVPKESLTGNLSVYLTDYDAACASYPLEEYLLYEKMGRQGSESPMGLATQDALMYGQEEWEEFCRQQGPALFPVPEGTDAESMQKLQEKMMFYMSCPGPRDKNRPGALYEMMFPKIAGYSARAVLWYQGESDENHAALYQELFTLLINTWRGVWKEDLPFIFAQLAPFESWLTCLGTNYPEVRIQQQRTEESLSHVYMVTLSDIGDRLDIHPKQKKPVGLRMALKARCYLFGEDIACEYPKPCSLTMYEGEIEVGFDDCRELVLQGEKSDTAALFEIRLDGTSCPVTDLRIEGRSLFLTCAQVREDSDAEVLFAQKPYYEVHLYNEAGIPAAPFII